MRRHGTAIDRRGFLRQSAALGLGTLFAPAFTPKAWAATKDRIVIYQGVRLDSLHSYGYSGGGITGISRHIIEPLIQMDYDRNEYVGVLAQSWEFQGRKWIFHLRKGVRFHNGAPFTSKDVAYSIDKLQNDKRSLQGAYAIYWGKDGVNGGKLPFYYAGSNGSDADVYFDQYFAPAAPSASTTTIRNSTSSSTRNNAPAIRKSASRFCIRRAAF